MEKETGNWLYKKIPKIAFTYWAGPMSKLHFLSIRSAVILNPDWEVYLYQPKVEYIGERTWTTPEHVIKYAGSDYRQHLHKIDRLKVITIDLEEIGFRNDVPEVFKSNYVTYHVLSTTGGVWFDTDILFVRPLSSLDLTGKIVKGDFNSIDVIISYTEEKMGKYFSTGILIGSPNNEFYKKILETLKKRFNPKDYMSATNNLYPYLFGDINGIQKVFPNLHYANLGMNIFYPFKWFEMDKLFHGATGIERITDKVVGIHWYNGAKNTELFLQQANYSKDVIINQVIKKFNLDYDLTK